jgi:hypothetical protein
MKKIKALLILLILIYSGSFFQPILAQEQSKTEQEKQEKLQQMIEEQKQSMIDQKLDQKEKEEQFMKQQKEMKVIVEGAGKQAEDMAREMNRVRIYTPRGDRYESFIMNPDGDHYFTSVFGGDSEKTTWEFSKSVKESTFKKEYSFDVEQSASKVIMSVMGDCKSGDIDIKIIMPGGKSYSDIVIDENGNLNWRKSFGISDTENKDKIGEWKFRIASNKATGHFKISLQTY